MNLPYFLLGHWGYSGNGMYYNGTHHDSLLQTDRIGTDREIAIRISKSILCMLTTSQTGANVEE
jgi:hypothetical protein